MKPVDFRDLTWDEIQERLDGMRWMVYDALKAHGPCTTRQLAERAHIDPFSVRPRVTELCQLGLARLGGQRAEDGDQRAGGREGIYESVPLAQAQALHARLRAERQESQLPLRLTA